MSKLERLTLLLKNLADVNFHIAQMTNSLNAVTEFTQSISLDDYPEMSICPECFKETLNAKSQCASCGYDDIRFMADELSRARRKLFQMNNNVGYFMEKHHKALEEAFRNKEVDEKAFLASSVDVPYGDGNEKGMPEIINIADYRRGR